VAKKQRQNITFVKTACFAYFGIKLGDQDKPWAPHTVCSVSVEDLRNWTEGKTKALRFGIQLAWHQPVNHVDDCYFCMCTLKGFNMIHKKGISYPILPSAFCPMALIYQCLLLLSNFIHWRLNEVPFPMNHQRILNMLPTHMAQQNLSPKLN
jgi:hypothetical protein